MARILLGVSGGIAAYKSLEFTRLAIKAGHVVRVVQTPDSQNFVGTASFAGITGAPVLIGQFERDSAGGVFPDQPRPAHDPIGHLALAENCDVFVIAPATANTIAKLAAGLTDNMLTALALGCRKPILVAPAMNNQMYLNQATAENIAQLLRRGIHVIEPETGQLASKGEFGIGRLPEPPSLLVEVERLLAAQSETPREPFVPRALDGLKLLVTAGGTREPIDAVRFIGNRSSGKMGCAIADEATARGAEVTMIAANVALDRNPEVTYIDVVTADELEATVASEFPAADALVMAAAVADFRPVAPADGKIKKAGRSELNLQLEATNDILAGIAKRHGRDQIVVGFAAEAGPDLLAEAERKLDQKGLDLIVANDIADASIGFEADDNEVTLIGRDRQPIHPPRGGKREIAAAILDQVEILIAERNSADRTS